MYSSQRTVILESSQQVSGITFYSIRLEEAGFVQKRMVYGVERTFILFNISRSSCGSKLNKGTLRLNFHLQINL